MKKVIDKTYLTRSGKDIRDSKMSGTYEVNISEANKRIADKRIKLAERLNATAVQNGQNMYAKHTLVRKK